MNSNTSNLDVIVVCMTLLMVMLIASGLMFVHDIPTANLPVLASLATALLGIPVAYGAFRWGSSVTAKRLSGTQEPGE